MRVQYIKITTWRHFENIEFYPPEDSSLICLIGANGSGKSQILELLAACAQQIGLTPGSESYRPSPFDGKAELEVQFYISENIVPELDEFLKDHLAAHPYITGWNRTLTISTNPNLGTSVIAGGVENDYADQVAQTVVGLIKSSSSIHYLSLDADRAFPKITIQSHELGAAFERDWELSNKESSFRLTKSLFEEWFRYLLGTENRESNLFMQSIRQARDNGEPQPEFIDHFENYKNSIKAVLPHLLFVGVDSSKREIKFDSTGLHLTFDQLSGGEREIAFLVGQIDRFGLSKGLLLLDEPELHLNNDLLRSWIGFLRGTVQEGQIWLATHSLEVVEVAGQDSTFLLERNQATRKVVSARSLSAEPIVSALSRSVGSPAFSISKLSFVFIEGTEEIGERERFRLLCEVPHHIRFMEGGSCKEVVRRVEELRALGQASTQAIRVGGIIDSDWRSLQDKQAFTSQGLHVLDVHEVENLFLSPPTLMQLCIDIGCDQDSLSNMLIEEFDNRAGVWIFDSTRTGKKFRDYPEPSAHVREMIHGASWSDFADIESMCYRIAAAHGGLSEPEVTTLSTHLKAHAQIYQRKSREADFWKFCQGKEIFRAMLPRLGLSNSSAGERAVMALWKRHPDLVPSELVGLRAYVTSL